MVGSVDYYKVLDVPRTATSAEIKAAYHRAAKRAHPDAGGNAEAMQLVNEAYSTLSSALNRREYDVHRASASATHTRATASRPQHHAANPAQQHPHAAARPRTARQPREYVFDPSLVSLARSSAWRIILYSTLTATVLGVILPYIYANTPDPTSKTIIALSAFAPMYFLAVGIVFLFKPSLRIALAQIASGQLPSRHDAQGLFALMIAAVPLAAFWLMGFSAGALK